MGFYSNYIFPRLCNHVLGQPHVAEQRRTLLAGAGGEVLEIGFGTGLNLLCYPRHVRQLTAIEPNTGMNRLAERHVRQTNIQVDLQPLSGDQLPFADNSFDCVVSTFTLCSINNIEQALREAFRVLRPGGHFLFLEHGLSPEPAIQKWQRRLNWLQTRIGDGCRLDRDMQALIARQPFSSIDAEQFYLERTPKTHGYMYRGAAIK